MVGNIKYQQAETNASDAHSFSVSVFEWSRGTRPNHDHEKLSLPLPRRKETSQTYRYLIWMVTV